MISTYSTGTYHPTTGYSHIAIGVTNMARSLPFYIALGFEVIVDRVEQGADNDSLGLYGNQEKRHVVYLRLTTADTVQFLSLHHRASMKNKPLTTDQIGINHAGIWVEDMDSVLNSALQAGGTVSIPPFVARGGGWTLPEGSFVRSTFLTDPDETLIQLDQIVPEPDDKNEVVG